MFTSFLPTIFTILFLREPLWTTAINTLLIFSGPFSTHNFFSHYVITIEINLLVYSF